MSSSWMENSGMTRQPSTRGIARRMVSLPQAILGEISRVMSHGRDLMGIGSNTSTRNQHHVPFSNSFENFLPIQHQRESRIHQHQHYEDPWAFLNVFEQQYGSSHPFFYACRLTEALKVAEEDKKFLFMYLHSQDHPFTPSFCRDTFCSELVVQFLDANFVSWGGLANGGEGSEMVATLRPGTFPFCVVVAPAPGNNINVLRQIEGPISPPELVEILQGTLEEQGLAFGSGRAKQEEKLRLDRRLREDQDIAYLAALRIDKEKELRKNSQAGSGAQRPGAGPNQLSSRPVETSSRITNNDPIRNYPSKKQQPDKSKDIPTATEWTHNKVVSGQGKNPQVTKILVRFPNGDKREQSFLCTDRLQSVFRYIDSIGLIGAGNYRLVSSFPRKAYGMDQMGMTLKDAGLHPRASLFIEPL